MEACLRGKSCDIVTLIWNGDKEVNEAKLLLF